MEAYGKVFRRYYKNDLDILLKSYNPDIEKYHDVVMKMKTEGFRQVIINSELMIEILSEVILKEGYILELKFTDNTDGNLISDVKSLVKNIRHDRLQLIKLKDVLNWALDNNSIDIVNAEFYYKEKKYIVYSNGIVEGNEINIFFNEIIRKVLLEYLS